MRWISILLIETLIMISVVLMPGLVYAQKIPTEEIWKIEQVKWTGLKIFN